MGEQDLTFKTNKGIFSYRAGAIIIRGKKILMIKENFVCKSFGDQGGKEHLHWLPIDDLEKYHLFPEFFKTKLLGSIAGFEHIVSKE